MGHEVRMIYFYDDGELFSKATITVEDTNNPNEFLDSYEAIDRVYDMLEESACKSFVFLEIATSGYEHVRPKLFTPSYLRI